MAYHEGKAFHNFIRSWMYSLILLENYKIVVVEKEEEKNPYLFPHETDIQVKSRQYLCGKVHALRKRGWLLIFWKRADSRD